MVFISQAFASLITAALLSQTILAHPGHDVGPEIARRGVHYRNNKRDISHCTDTLRKRGNEEKHAKRRQNEINKLRKARNITKRKNVARQTSPLDVSHLSTLDVNDQTKSSGYYGVEDIIFSNSSCILMPEGEAGPFYVDGEFIRRDIREDQAGFDVLMDAQFIDVNTCSPIPGIMWDVWHANATGVYGGVIGSGNGDEADTSNLNNTFLRGLQMTDGDGVAQFMSIFPGHYAGRATHTHVIAHMGGTVLSNGTYSGGSIPYVGQLFYDQDLISQVNELQPYSLDTIAVTQNADDRVVADEIANGGSPFFNYVLLGDTVADGMFMWVDIGIDPTAQYTAAAASDWTANGGVQLSSVDTNSALGGRNSTMGAPFGNSTGSPFGNSTAGGGTGFIGPGSGGAVVSPGGSAATSVAGAGSGGSAATSVAGAGSAATSVAGAGSGGGSSAATTLVMNGDTGSGSAATSVAGAGSGGSAATSVAGAGGSAATSPAGAGGAGGSAATSVAGAGSGGSAATSPAGSAATTVVIPMNGDTGSGSAATSVAGAGGSAATSPAGAGGAGGSAATSVAGAGGAGGSAATSVAGAGGAGGSAATSVAGAGGAGGSAATSVAGAGGSAATSPAGAGGSAATSPAGAGGSAATSPAGAGGAGGSAATSVAGAGGSAATSPAGAGATPVGSGGVTTPSGTTTPALTQAQQLAAIAQQISAVGATFAMLSQQLAAAQAQFTALEQAFAALSALSA